MLASLSVHCYEVHVLHAKHLKLLQAAKALLAEASVAGHAFFITNDDARPFWTFLGNILAGLDYEPRLRPHIKLPYLLVFTIAAILEYLVRARKRPACAVLPSAISDAGYNWLHSGPQVMPLCKALGKPLTASEFTVNRIAISASNRRFDITRAKTQLGYQPLVSVDEGVARTIKAFSHLRAETNGKHV